MKSLRSCRRVPSVVVLRYSLSILEVARVERKVSSRDAVLLPARRLRLEDLLDSEDFRASGSIKEAKR
jgi:hypothetical protein